MHEHIAVLERIGLKRTADLPISGALSRLSLTLHNHGFTYFPTVLMKQYYLILITALTRSVLLLTASW